MNVSLSMLYLIFDRFLSRLMLLGRAVVQKTLSCSFGATRSWYSGEPSPRPRDPAWRADRAPFAGGSDAFPQCWLVMDGVGIRPDTTGFGAARMPGIGATCGPFARTVRSRLCHGAGQP
jgi:hypothetical protein